MGAQGRPDTARVAGKHSALERCGNHSSILVCNLTEKPGRPQSIGSKAARVGHNQSDPTCIEARIFVFAHGSSAPNTDY